jgi:hypothetical protein
MYCVIRKKIISQNFPIHAFLNIARDADLIKQTNACKSSYYQIILLNANGSVCNRRPMLLDLALVYSDLASPTLLCQRYPTSGIHNPIFKHGSRGRPLPGPASQPWALLPRSREMFISKSRAPRWRGRTQVAYINTVAGCRQGQSPPQKRKSAAVSFLHFPISFLLLLKKSGTVIFISLAPLRFPNPRARGAEIET